MFCILVEGLHPLGITVSASITHYSFKAEGRSLLVARAELNLNVYLHIKSLLESQDGHEVLLAITRSIVNPPHLFVHRKTRLRIHAVWLF